jgi:hypothetical protein
MNSGLDLGRRYPGEIRKFLELISIQAFVDGRCSSAGVVVA